jgi:signal transduction histidine kinase
MSCCPAPRHRPATVARTAAGALLCASVAQAANAAARAQDPAELGPWLFASVALVLVAVLAWQLGRGTGRREGRADARARLGAKGATPAAPPAAAAARSAPGPSRGDEAAAFGYALSHDLRAPLRVVEGFARILKEDYGRQLDRIGNDHLDRLLGAAARMHSMIEGMLVLAQLSEAPLERQPINLSQLAGFVVDDLRRAEPQRHVDVDIAPGLEVVGDPGLLRRMLENLIGNAWKYTARKERARISLRARTQEGQTVYEVADNGAGFDMRNAGRLFGMFQRLHGQTDFPGTGLGLASVQRIVQRHGGRIWAEAEPGRGARFQFTLPG